MRKVAKRKARTAGASRFHKTIVSSRVNTKSGSKRKIVFSGMKNGPRMPECNPPSNHPRLNGKFAGSVGSICRCSRAKDSNVRIRPRTEPDVLVDSIEQQKHRIYRKNATEIFAYKCRARNILDGASRLANIPASRMKQPAAKRSSVVVSRVSRFSPSAAEPQNSARRSPVFSHLYCSAKPVIVSSRT